MIFHDILERQINMAWLHLTVQPEQQPVIIPMQGQQIVYGADNQQYVLVQQQNPPQNGLITASYTCSGIGLLIFGIILGPIGFILGLVAKSNGDPRGNGAMVFGGVVTAISAVLVVILLGAGI